MNPIDFARYSLSALSDSSAIICPPIFTSPESIWSSPERQLSSVVFPHPLGPMTDTISPFATSSETPSSAVTSKSRLL